MSFNIVIKVDSQQAEQQLSRVHEALAKTEDVGPRAGAAITKGAKDSEVAMKQLASSVEGTRKSLLEVEGSFGKSIANRFGDAGELAQGLTSGKLAAGAVVGLTVEIAHLGDEYTRMQQAALRLAPSMGQVDGVISQQLALSRDLHSSLEKTIELSVAVKERTEALGLAEHEQAQIVRTLGSAAVLAGKDTMTAAEAFSRLTFAMENAPETAGRAMKQMLLEFPPLAEGLAKSLHLPQQELLQMVKTGKIAPEQMIAAFRAMGPELQEKASKVPETLGQRWDHFKDDLAGTADSVGSSFNKIASSGLKFVDEYRAQEEEIGRKSRVFWEKVHADVEEIQGRHQREQVGALGRFVVQMDQTWSRLRFIDPWAGLGGDAQKIVDLFSLIGKNAKQVQDAKDQLVALKQAYAGGSISALKFRTEYEALVTTIEGGMSAYRRVANEIRDANRTYHEDVAALGLLYRQGVVGIEEQEAALRKLKNPIAEAREEMKKFWDDLDARREKDQTLREQSGIGGRGSLSDDERRIAEGALAGRAADQKIAMEAIKERRDEQLAAFEERKKMGEKTEESFKKFNEEQLKAEAEQGKRMAEALTGPMSDAITDLATKGKLDFKAMIDSMIANLIRLGLQIATEKALMGAFSGQSTNKGFLGSGGGGPDAGSFVKDLLGGIPLLAGFAHGGDMFIRAASGFSGTVPGFGGTDSRFVGLAVTPGEHIAVRTPQQQRDAARGQDTQAPVHVHVHNHVDSSEMVGAMDSRPGDTVIVNSIKRNAPAIRSFLGL